MKTLLYVLLIGCTLSSLAQVQVRFQPGDVLYVYENGGAISKKMTYSAVIQNLAVVNKSNDSINLNKVEIRAYKAGRLQQVKALYSDAVSASMQTLKFLESNGYLELMDFQYQLSQYLQDASLAATGKIASDEAIVLTHIPFLFEQVPDSLQVAAIGSNDDQLASSSIPVSNFSSANSYIFPLKGRWTAAAGPSLIGHHRWGSLQEFALDFIKIGNDGLTYEGSETSNASYYAYGEPVFSIGDGEVVSVLDEIDEFEEMLKRAGESEEEYLKRTIATQRKLISQGFKHALGNHVIIKHPNEEYSYYLHLQPNSVQVKVGEQVGQGQQIGRVGNSGNSTEAHLHFHVSNSPDIKYSRSLPVVFENIKLYPDDNGQIRHLHSGQVIDVED